MTNDVTDYLKIVNWQTVQAEIFQTEPDLHKILTRLNPSDNLKLVKVRYPFGARIFHQGTVYLPTNHNNSVPITSQSLPKEITSLLDHCCLPLGINLNKIIEGYKNLEGIIHPFVLLEPSLSLGTWEFLACRHLDHDANASTSNISLTAGAKSIFMLPKITDSTCHKRLKKEYGIKSFPPKSYLDHAGLFAELVNSVTHENKWFCDVIYFTNDWTDKIINDHSWAEFNALILQRSWNQTRAGRITPLIDSIWFNFFQAVIESGRKINVYLLDTVQRLFYVSLGLLPAMTPNSNDHNIAPVELIEKIYTDDYKLKKYFPTVMTPALFKVRDENPSAVYYSLQLPTVISSSFYNPYSVMDDLIELQELMRIFSRVLTKTDLVIEGIRLATLPQLISVEYFHTETYSSQGILPTTSMPSSDSNLLKFNGNNPGDRQFADKSHYVKGCVRISKL
ncbi:MAG: hypothetical protein M3R00_04925 [Pseudomonadota bacterium]|nr:hypothetical protein [Pseudomonadota bacterium]